MKLLENVRSAAELIEDAYREGSGETGFVSSLMSAYGDEINLIDEKGMIVQSTNAENVGIDMHGGEQSQEFLDMLESRDEYVQSYQPRMKDGTYFKYAAKKLESGGFVQIGLDSESYYKTLEERVKIAAENRHIGRSGFVLILDKDFNIVSAPHRIGRRRLRRERLRPVP